jgi:hypothetical protein
MLRMSCIRVFVFHVLEQVKLPYKGSDDMLGSKPLDTRLI